MRRRAESAHRARDLGTVRGIGACAYRYVSLARRRRHRIRVRARDIDAARQRTRDWIWPAAPNALITRKVHTWLRNRWMWKIKKRRARKVHTWLRNKKREWPSSSCRLVWSSSCYHLLVVILSSSCHHLVFVFLSSSSFRCLLVIFLSLSSCRHLLFVVFFLSSSCLSSCRCLVIVFFLSSSCRLLFVVFFSSSSCRCLFVIFLSSCRHLLVVFLLPSSSSLSWKWLSSFSWVIHVFVTLPPLPSSHHSRGFVPLTTSITPSPTSLSITSSTAPRLHLINALKRKRTYVYKSDLLPNLESSKPPAAV